MIGAIIAGNVGSVELDKLDKANEASESGYVMVTS